MQTSFTKKNTEFVSFTRKLQKTYISSGITEIIDIRRKLFLKPVVHINEIITDEIEHIAIEKYFDNDKSMSNL